MNRNLATLITLGLVPLVVSGDISDVIDKASGGISSGTTITIPLTNNASANTMLHVVVTAVNGTLTNRSATKVVYGTSGNTNCTRYARQDDGTSLQASSWYLLSPPTGSNNLVVTYGGSTGGAAQGTTWNGVKQSGQPDATTSHTFTTTTTPSITNTCVVSGCLIVDNLIKNLITGTVTVPATQTILGNSDVGTAYRAVSSYQIGTPSGTNIFFYTFSLTSAGSWAIGSFSPATTTNLQQQLGLMGVGQ